MPQLTDDRPNATESAPVECGLCRGLIAHIPAPSHAVGAWEGWFHLDPSREHFGRVGPR